MIPLRDNVPLRETPFVVWNLMVLNGLVFLCGLSLSAPSIESFVDLFGLVQARYTIPEWASWAGLHPHNYWPFVTTCLSTVDGSTLSEICGSFGSSGIKCYEFAMLS
jgi:membrane associated rhomboid family serine protease